MKISHFNFWKYFFILVGMFLLMFSSSLEENYHFSYPMEPLLDNHTDFEYEDFGNTIVYSHSLKTIVVLVFVDKKFIHFHGKGNYERYILTLMGMVDQAFHHYSLGMTVEVWLQGIHILSQEEFKKISFDHGVSKTLNDFCKTAHKIRAKHYVEERIDIMALLTRDKIGPAGFAPVGSICSGYQNCLLVHDRGLSSAYVFAHELGHTLGMVHDGESNECDETPYDGKIMATRVLSNYYMFYWSMCSRSSFNDMLASATCLDKIPNLQTSKALANHYYFSFPNSWSLHEQCKQEFGEGFCSCPHIITEYSCERLSCLHYVGYSRICVTKRNPALPRTTCGRGKWCDKHCVQVNPNAIDGKWSIWSNWSPCSRTCGTGFKTRTRKCNNPSPTKSGKFCRQQPDEYKLCIEQPCKGLSDFRAEQCEDVGLKWHGDTNPQLIPVENKNSSLKCKLTCMSELYGKTVLKRLVDGTFCSYEDPHSLCYKGSCKKIGCDGFLNSDAKEDFCGVCRGNNKKCKKVHGQFYLEIPSDEYYHMFMIPKHARNIILREQYSEAHANHYFAIKETISGKWHLNGNKTFITSKSFVANGALFNYANDFMGESLRARGPLLSPISLLVYSKSENKTQMTYQYYLHEDDYSSEEYKGFDWVFYRWSKCSKKCDQGYKYKMYRCFKNRKKYEPKFCSHLIPPIVQKLCNQHLCSDKYWWFADDFFSPCSVSCGVGTRKKKVKCMANLNGELKETSQRNCDRRKKPKGVISCFKPPCKRSKRIRTTPKP